MPDPRLPEAIVFDLDGTLVDSAPDLMRAANRVLAAEGRRAISLDEVKMFIGDGVPKLIERAIAATRTDPAEPPLDPARHERLVTAFLEIYDGEGTVLTRPFPGAVEMLARLKGLGIRLGVCTNKPQKSSEQILSELGLATYLDAVLGGDVLPTRKPDAAPLREVLRRLGATARTAVMVGDQINDVLTARAAGVPVIAVTFGYPRMPVTELGADRLIDGFDQLPAACTGLVGSHAGESGEGLTVR